MLNETFSVSFKLLPFSFKIVACGPSSESAQREDQDRTSFIEDDDIPDDEYARPDIIEDNDIPDDEYSEYFDTPGSIQPQIRGNAVFPSITEVSLK